MTVALITGASSGIGSAFAKLLASEGRDVVLVARSGDKLNALKAEIEKAHQVKAYVISIDLTQIGAAKEVFDATNELGLKIEFLINNAGFGGHGLFCEQSLEKHQNMIQVNIAALAELTYMYLPQMQKDKRGYILNVSSTASFMPGPLQAVYYATKAFVTSFSQAVAEEVKDFNINVTALCPGAVATGFVEAGDLNGVDLWKNAKSPESVAEFGYKALMRGDLVAINEGGLKFMLDWIIPLLPRKTVLKLSRQAMEKK